MSRCFPFPPPGYEKSARTDVVDILAKEKIKEKKHKKEKRDKDRKDKEGSKDKHRDKKDRKEKHKDKKEKDKKKDKNKTSDGRKPENKINDQNREKSAEVSNLAGEHTNKKVLEELDRRIKDEQGAGNRIGNDAMDQRNLLSSPYTENVRTGGDDRRHEKHKEGSKLVGNENTPLDQRRQEGMLRAFENDMEKGMEITETNKEEGDKHKDREKEKKRKNKDRDKEKKKEKEKVNVKFKEKADLKQIEQNQHGLHTSEGVGVLKAMSRPPLLNDGKFGCMSEDNRKRKEIEINGFTHESGNWPNKLPRVAATSHLPLENGRKPELLCMPNLFGHDRQESSDGKLIIERKKDGKINGIVEAGISSVSLITPAGGKVHESGEASAPKPPHPDVKYLNQLYDIPKVEEWCDPVDNQEWLFGSGDTNSGLKKPMVNPEDSEIAPQVWAEAVLLPATDIYALPYVIPR